MQLPIKLKKWNFIWAKLRIISWTALRTLLLEEAERTAMYIFKTKDHTSKCGAAGEDTWEVFILQEDQTSQSWGNLCWTIIGRTDAKDEAPILWPSDAESTHWKSPWCWESLRAGGEESDRLEMVGWHHQLNGHEFQQTPWDSEGQESLACCIPWGCKELDMTEQLNSNNSKPVKPGNKLSASKA